MDGLITMSKKELSKLEGLQKMSEKRISQKEAASILNLSERQIKRLWKAYRKDGAIGLLPLIIPGEIMVIVSMDNQFHKTLPIIKTDFTQEVSFPLFAKNCVKYCRAHFALPSFWPRVGAPVALQQSRILRTSDIIISYYLGSLSQVTF